MQAAKDAVRNFTSKSGHHDTTVHEKVAPAVTNETISRQQEDRVTTAVDKEVHQDHYHTSVQPIKHNEVLPEKHHHNLAAVEHRKVDHDDSSRVKETLAAEQAKFRDTTTQVDGQRTTSTMPVVAGEHVHHHVHETVQPVVQKQTVEPHVVHTTVPIHEVHHNAAQHHATSALPAMSMSDFKNKGGALTGRDERTDAFDGCPKEAHGSGVGSATGAGLGGVHSHDKAHTGSGLTGSNTAGSGLTGSSRDNTTGTGLTSNRDNNNMTGNGLTGSNRDHNNSGINSVAGSGLQGGTGTGNNLTSSSHTGTSSGHHHESSLTGNRNQDLPQSVTGFSPGSDKTHNTTGAGTTGTSGSRTSNDSQAKPSLLDRLNPMKDSDHDGKKGFMK